MTKQDVKEAVIEALKDHHPCVFSEDERGILRDVVKIGQGVKAYAIKAIVLVLVVSMAAGLYFAKTLAGILGG